MLVPFKVHNCEFPRPSLTATPLTPAGLKEEVENFEHFGDYTLGSTEVRALPKDAFPEDGPPRMEDTLEVLLKRLEEKRREAVRTEDLDVST